MGNESSFVPKILLCGDEAEFLSRIEERPFKIVGHAQIAGEVDGQPFDFVQDNKILFNGELQDLSALVKFLRSGAVDYFLFINPWVFANFRNNAYKRGFMSSQVVTLEQFKASSPDFFYDANADLRLLPFLKKSAVKTLLDVDGYFTRGRVFTKLSNDFTEIDAVSDEPLPPITENIYTHVYKTLTEVGFKRYDAALVIEREPIDFNSAFILLENFTDTMITFARLGSELEKHIRGNLNRFAEVRVLGGGAVNWYFLKRLKPPEDFCNYVVTHKTIELNGLPDGYKIIHAGRAVNGELGYQGDDTGDNISRLNPYLNEMTALYWMWKNTAHTMIGLCHYRRFFTTSDDTSYAYEKILTHEDTLKILERYDIIVSEVYYGGLTQREWIVNDFGEALTKLVETIIKKHLMQAQPDYLDAFDFVINSSTLYKCNMFVTRRNIFDAYCKWLFSFYLEAAQELFNAIGIDKITDRRRRILGYFSERMMTTWLRKNRLRIKELPIMFIEGI